MALKEMCIITFLLLAVNSSTSVVNSRNKSLLELKNEVYENLTTSFIEFDGGNEEASGNNETGPNIERPLQDEKTLKDSFKLIQNKSNLETNEKNIYGEIDNSDVSMELSIFEKFRPSIAGMMIILFNHKTANKNRENEAFQNNIYASLDSLNQYSTQISIIDIIKFLIELEKNYLNPSNISIPFKSKENVEIMFMNLSKKFLKLFAYDYKVNKFPLVFYDTILPFLRKELLPIISNRKIDDRISWFLAYEMRRPELFEELENLVNSDELLNEHLNLEFFLNMLNKTVKTCNVDTQINRDVKLSYIILFNEFTGIMKEETNDKFSVKRIFAALLKALLFPSIPEAENSKTESIKKKLKLKWQEKESGRKEESHFPIANIYEIYSYGVRQAADWFKGLMDFLLQVKDGEKK